MAERKHINLVYQYNDNWIGGTYYILNIIKALKFLDDDSKPFLTIYCDPSSDLKNLHSIEYPYMDYVACNFKLSLSSKIANKLFYPLLGKELFTVKLPGNKINNFYYYSFLLNKSNLYNYYSWIADFQDLYLPQFFKKTELNKRLSQYQRMVNEKVPIVFSSNAALNDFNKFYPGNANKKKVVKFVSIQDMGFNSLSIDALKTKFNIKGDYFIVSNQFWKHKNHPLVLEAFKELFEKYTSFQLVLTGKEHDYRYPGYVDELKEYVRVNNLADKILFLGFIDRDEQLKLMAESLAIIQPSLFEGWSTVVEDAKLLKKCILCSDLPVHHEQLPNSDLFFNPADKQQLINTVERVINNESSYDVAYNHHDEVIKFANDFVSIF